MIAEVAAAELKHNKQIEGVMVEIGSKLRRARESRNLTQHDIAQRLHLKLQTVAAIEQDEYEKLPAPTFTKGYLRLYAQLVGLSADDIIESYNRLGYADTPVTKLTTQKRITTNSTGKLLCWLFMLVLLTLLLLVGRWLYLQNILHYKGIEPVLNAIEPSKTKMATTS